MTWTAPDTEPTRRAIGQTELFVHPIGIDGSVFGWAAGVEETAAVLDAFSAGGGNLISTADHHAGGRSEVMIGSWLRSRRARGEMVVATKVGRHPDNPGLAPLSIVAAVDASLERLGVDRIDLLSLDGESVDTPIEESLGAVAELVAVGKVGALGVAAFGKKALKRCEVAAERGLPEVRAIVAEYNLLRRTDYEKNIEQFAVKHNSCALARLPLANGFLSGEFRSEDDFPSSGIYMDAVQHWNKRGRRVLDALDEISAELGQTPGRVAVAWVLARPGIASAIARARSAQQIDELLTASMLQLDTVHMARLDKASS